MKTLSTIFVCLLFVFNIPVPSHAEFKTFTQTSPSNNNAIEDRVHQYAVPRIRPAKAPKGGHHKNVREGNREKHEKADGRRQREQRKAEEKREASKKKD